MRILFIHPNFPAQFPNIASALAGNPENQVVFLTARQDGELAGVHKVIYAKSREPASQTHRYVRTLEDAVLQGQAAYRIAAELKRQGFVPDVIYGHSGWGPTLYMKDVFPNTPLICYFEWFYRARGSDSDFDPGEPLSIDAECRIRTNNASMLIDLVSCDQGVCPTFYQHSQLPREFQNKIKVLHDGVNTEYYQPQEGAKLVLPDINLDLSEVDELVTYVGRGMEPYRGFPQFMEGVEILLRRRPKCHVVIVGADRVAYGRELPDGKTYKQLMLEKLDLDLQRVHFTGLLPYGMYRRVLQASSVHVYLTRPFVLSWSMLEAMSAGCLLVASNTDPVKEVIQDGVNGLLVDFFAPQQIADRVEEALDHPTRMADLRGRARETILDRYDLQKLLPQQVALLQTVARNSKQAAVSGTEGDVSQVDNAKTEGLLKLLPPDARVIVEFGCGYGELGKLYQSINPQSEYIGIVQDIKAAQNAAGRLKRVVVGSAENIMKINAEILKKGTVDCLIYRDSLEQTRDPWTVLKQHAACLREGGQVIACIPNVQHWSILFNLLSGKWEYNSEGVLNKDNLRFFTVDSIKDMFVQAGLHIFDIQVRGYGSEQSKKFQQLLSPAATEMGLDTGRLFAQSEAFEYVIRATRQPVTRRLWLQSFLGETKVCARVRIAEPHSFMATIPGVRNEAGSKMPKLKEGRPDEDKVFIWQRIWPDSVERQRELIRRGYLVIAEIDDDPLRWRDYHESNDFFAFRSCHGIQTSTQPLADYLRRFNPNVAVFPNQLAFLPQARVYKEDGPVTIFFGALNREQDWRPIMPAINNVLRSYSSKIQVKVIHDKLFFEALQTANKEFIGFCPYAKYQEIMHTADIGLLPLSENRFNSMKSDLKFLECAGHGVTVLASPTVYDQSIQDGKTGFIYRTVDELASKLRILIERPDIRRCIAANAYHWVRDNRMLYQHYRQRWVWYKLLIDKLPNLNEELRQRVPELWD